MNPNEPGPQSGYAAMSPEEAAAYMTPEQMAQYVARPMSKAARGASSKLLGAILIAAVGLGASALSCVGQSFSLRQARALEGIEQQLVLLRASCAVHSTIGAEGAR